MEEEYVFSAPKASSKLIINDYKTSPQRISELDIPDYMRSDTGMGELDRVLGGGIVKGILPRGHGFLRLGTYADDDYRLYYGVVEIF